MRDNLEVTLTNFTGYFASVAPLLDAKLGAIDSSLAFLIELYQHESLDNTTPPPSPRPPSLETN